MGKLHLFNPDNDLALAANLDHYTAPKAAVAMRNAGEMLPFWYADAGDKVACRGVNARWLSDKQETFGIEVDVCGVKPDLSLDPSPWGWSKAARTSFINIGFSMDRLPDDVQLDRIRNLSHRRTAAAIATELAQMLPQLRLNPPAREVTDISEIPGLIREWGDIFIKEPWSGSGRGIVSTIVNSDSAILQAENFIRRQGSAMVERAVDKAIDFARIYSCRGGHCEDLGTSVFLTDSRGCYTGNLLASEDERRAAVCQYIRPEELRDVSSALREIIERNIAPYYSGILGVDMLVGHDGTLHPVVEVNLRKTMGYVALRFADRYLHAGSRGSFTIVPTPGGLPQDPENYRTEGFRISSGVLYLTPSPSPFAFKVKVN